jgi:hypothetical protein
MAAYGLGRMDARLELYRVNPNTAVERRREARKLAAAGSVFAEISLGPSDMVVATEFESFAVWHFLWRRVESLRRLHLAEIRDENLRGELDEARRLGYEGA